MPIADGVQIFETSSLKETRVPPGETDRDLGIAHLDPPHRPWYRRRVPLVILGVVLLALIGVIVFALAWSQRGAEEASLDKAVESFRKTGRQHANAGLLQPESGVYTYRGSGDEKLSLLNTTQHWGPLLPGTVTRGKNDCWSQRIEYSTNHWQQWDYCPKGRRLVETGGQTFQSFDFVVTHVEDLNVFTCTPKSDAIRLDVRRDSQWSHQCTGESESRGTSVTSSGTNTYLGRATVDVDGQSVAAYHYREEHTLSGSQTGTERMDQWFATRDGLLLRIMRDVHVDSPSPIGSVTYTERGSFTLTSLDPVH